MVNHEKTLLFLKQKFDQEFGPIMQILFTNNVVLNLSFLLVPNMHILKTKIGYKKVKNMKYTQNHEKEQLEVFKLPPKFSIS